MAALTIQAVVKDGLEATFASADAGGDTFANTGAEFVHIKNGGGSQITLTIATSKTVDGLTVPDRTVAIPAGEERYVGPLLTDTHGSTVSLSYSAVTSVTLAVLQLTQVN